MEELESRESNQKYKRDERVQISQDTVEELIKEKSVIRCENGVAQVDEFHPEYDFWMED